MEQQDILLSNLRRLNRDCLFFMNDIKELDAHCECVFSEDVESAKTLYQQATSLFKDYRNKIPRFDAQTATVEFLTLKLNLAELYGDVKDKCKQNKILFH